MENLRIYFPLVNGRLMPYEWEGSGKQLIEKWTTDDWGAPPVSMVLEAKTSDGRTVTISIPYNDRGNASADISDEGS